MRPLALVVEQVGPGVDPEPALAAVPAALRYVLRPPELASVPARAGVQVLTATWCDREQAAALVHREAPAAVVVVLAPDERVYGDLASALVDLCREDKPGAYRVRRARRFLGREIDDGEVVIAWRGDPIGAPSSGRLAGVLLKLGEDVKGTIADLDAQATRFAAGRPLVTMADFSIRPAGALARRLWARRKYGVPGAVLSVVETYGEVFAAARVWERTVVADRGKRASSIHGIPQEFTAFETRAGYVVVRDGVSERLLQVVLDATPESVEGEPLAGGGRGGTWAVTVGDGSRAVLRWYRRGGALRHFVRDRYFGWRPRPIAELVLTEQARRRGVAAVEVLAARVDRLPAGFYRGALVTREIERAETLGEVLRRRPLGNERRALIVAVARALRTMHDCGVHHRDLNVDNILVRFRGGSMDGPIEVHLIDFDRGKLCRAVRVAARRRALGRLARSLAKLDCQQGPMAEEDRAEFHRAYWKEH